MKCSMVADHTILDEYVKQTDNCDYNSPGAKTEEKDETIDVAIKVVLKVLVMLKISCVYIEGKVFLM